MAQIKGADFRVEGLVELENQFARVGKFPKKYLTKAAREGIADPLKKIKASAPVGKRTKTKGTLKKSVKKKMEEPNKRNKGVYRIAYDPKFTDTFHKPTTGRYGGSTPFAYYPSSVEYGYKGPDGHVRVKTEHWAEKILRANEKASAKKVVDSLNKSITELLNKQ
jgi:hypothetical protein